MRFDSFNGDYEELARLVEAVWGPHFRTKTRFDYPPDWLVGFFGGPDCDPSLLIELRDASGALTAFIGAIPRRYLIHGQEVRLGLVTLLTSARTNVGFVGLEIERELYQRAANAGLFGTSHFCLDGQRTPDLLRWAATSRKTKSVELQSVRSMLAAAKPVVDQGDLGVRPVSAADAPAVAALIESAGRSVAVSRLLTGDEFVAQYLDHKPTPKRCLMLLRDGRPVGVCVYMRRKLIGNETTEVANIDLLVGPDCTLEESKRFGRAIAGDAANHGAAFVVAPQRLPAIFPYAREAGLRLAPRTLRVFIVPSGPEQRLEAGSAHLLEVE